MTIHSIENLGEVIHIHFTLSKIWAKWFTFTSHDRKFWLSDSHSLHSVGKLRHSPITVSDTIFISTGVCFIKCRTQISDSYFSFLSVWDSDLKSESSRKSQHLEFRIEKNILRGSSFYFLLLLFAIVRPLLFGYYQYYWYYQAYIRQEERDTFC